jgi:hypothetical protein
MGVMVGSPEHLAQLEMPQRLLDEVRKRLEAHFTVYPFVGTSGIAPTGENYCEIVSGLRPEVLHATPEDAIADWEKLIDTYATQFDPLPDEGRYTLYWRIMPEIDYWEGSPDHPRTGWKVYARLLISNKPVT